MQSTFILLRYMEIVMLNDLKSVIEKIYFDGEKSFFINGCKKSFDFVDELVENFEEQCSKIQLSDDNCLPAKEMYFFFEDFTKGEFKVSYSSVLCISKICKVFYLQHEFAVDNLDVDRMDLVLDGFGDQAYTKKQFSFDENVVSFLQKKGYTRLKYAELEEVIPFVEMPADLIFETQMTVENAIFRDTWELCSQE